MQYECLKKIVKVRFMAGELISEARYKKLSWEDKRCFVKDNQDEEVQKEIERNRKKDNKNN